MVTLEDVKKAAETATYIDEDGEKKTGTILQTAQAAATGAQTAGVQTASKQAVTGESPAAGTTPTGTVLQGYLDAAEGADYYKTQADLYKGMLELQQQQNRESADLATESMLEEIARQTEKLETQYGQNDKELYRDYRKDLRDLPQQLAAMGITGGLSETSRVDLESGYGENLNKSQLQRLAAIADLDAQGVAAKRENDAAARAQDVTALQAYYNALITLGGQKYQEDLTKERQSAETLATMGDFSGYVKLGLMTEEQAEQMKKLWIAENPKAAVQMGYVKASSGGGGSYRDTVDDNPVEQVDWVNIAKDGLKEVDKGASAGTVINDIASLYEVGAISSSGAKAAIQYVANQGYKNVTKPASD